jgi:lipoyl(octanoyl) transferase
MNLIFHNFGLQNYQTTYQKMKDFTQARNENTPDEIWFLEHPPVFTQGRGGKPEHILKHGNIPIISTDRGGQITYHGQGQLIAYFLIDLKRNNMNIRHLIDLIEQSVIMLLQNNGIDGHLIPHQPGVYVTHQKIASLGLHIKKGCSYHGLSLNIDMDLEPFSWINPCGYQNLKMTQLKDLGVGKPMREIINELTVILKSKNYAAV